MLSKVVEASKGGSEHAQITTTVYRTDKEESKFVLTMVKNPHHVLSIQVTIEKNIVQECFPSTEDSFINSLPAFF